MPVSGTRARANASLHLPSRFRAIDAGDRVCAVLRQTGIKCLVGQHDQDNRLRVIWMIVSISAVVIFMRETPEWAKPPVGRNRRTGGRRPERPLAGQRWAVSKAQVTCRSRADCDERQLFVPANADSRPKVAFELSR